MADDVPGISVNAVSAEASSTYKPPASDAFEELGLSGLKRFNGYIYEEFLPQLQGERGRRTFREMEDNDPTVGAFIFAISMFLRKVEWSAHAYDDSPQATVQAQFLEECMDDMSHTWPDMISEIMTMLVYGWQFCEICYKRRLGDEPGPAPEPEGGYLDPDNPLELPTSKFKDGLIGWRKMAPRAQDTLLHWLFDEEGGVQGIVQQSPPDYKITVVPIQKGLLFRTASKKNNPEGRSILRNAYRPWYFKRRIEEIEGVGIERDLAGLPVAYVPAEFLSKGASPDQKAVVSGMQNLVKNVRRDEQEGIVFPVAYDVNGKLMYDFKLLASTGARQFNTDTVLQRKANEIANVVLAQFIMLGTSEVGTYALSADKSGMFQAALSAWLDVIAEVFNRYAIPRLFKLNGFDITNLPTITHDDVSNPSLEEVSALITALATAGYNIAANTEIINAILRMAKLPEFETEKDSTEPDTAQPESGAQVNRTATDVQADTTMPQPPQPGTPPATSSAQGNQ